MPLYPDQIEDRFFEQVPQTFARNLLRVVFTARRLTWDHCQAEFPSEEADNVRPWYARGKIESGIREAAELVDGMSAKVVKAPKSGWNHTEITSGSVLLTAAAVQTPCGPVDKAEFRQGLAKSNQRSLFGDEENDGPLFTLLLHSPYHPTSPDDKQKFGYLPGSAYLAFPAADLDSYAHAINLFDRYPEVVAANYPQEWDEVARLRYLHNAQKSTWFGVA
ncbi:MAG: hypothetical protein LC775_00845 [Acidobacteria bacterium]|nr:hypothetical protein [Acidobacteriota bacterium]